MFPQFLLALLHFLRNLLRRALSAGWEAGTDGWRGRLRLLVGVGLMGCLVGGGSLLLLGLSAGVAMLGRYVRLHYRLLEPDDHNPRD